MSAQGSDGFKSGKSDPWKTRPGNDNDKEHDLDEVFVRGHAWMTYTVLKDNMGLSPLAAHLGRSGNWQRDFSQALLPLYEVGSTEIEAKVRKTFPDFRVINKKKIVNVVFKLLDILHRDEFNFPLNAREFGTYDPIEHLDNPAGERGTGVFIQVDGKDHSKNVDYIDNLDISGGKKEPYFIKEPRYFNTGDAGDFEINRYCSVPFKINDSGIVSYVEATKSWIEKRLFLSAVLGATHSGNAGPREFASAVHGLQDYFFHSNFIEIAINNILKRNGKKLFLDTHIYEFAATDDPSKEPKFSKAGRRNLSVTDKTTLAERQVLITGTFATDDTIQSLIDEVKDKLLHNLDLFNPAKKPEKETNGIMLACLDVMEEIAKAQMLNVAKVISTELKKQINADVTRKIDDAFKAINDNKNRISGEIRKLETEILKQSKVIEDLVNQIGSGINVILKMIQDNFPDPFGFLRSFKNARIKKFNLEDEKRVFARQLDRIHDDIENFNLKKSDFIKALNTILDPLSKQGNIASTIYTYLTPDPLGVLKNAADKIDGAGDPLVGVITNIELAIYRTSCTLLRPLYETVVTVVINDILSQAKSKSSETDLYLRFAAESYIPKEEDRELMKHTFVGQNDKFKEKDYLSKSRLGYWPPSHSTIAKDHPPLSLNKSHTHQHVDAGAWLHPIAEIMALAATQEIGTLIKKCWDDKKYYKDKIAACIDSWICHPMDNTEKFEQFLPITFLNKSKTEPNGLKKEDVDASNFVERLESCKNDTEKITVLKKILEDYFEYDNYISDFNKNVKSNMVVS